MSYQGIFLAFFLLPLSFSAKAQENTKCENGSWLTLEYPNCVAPNNLKPLEKSCKHPSHGLETTPVSTTPIIIESDWVGGGNANYEQQCRNNLGLADNQQAIYIGKIEEQSRKRLKTEYKYTCQFNIITYEYIDEVSEACTPIEERQIQTQGDICLDQSQRDVLWIYEDVDYSGAALTYLIGSLTEPKWTKHPEGASLPDGNYMVSICSTCSDLAANLPKSELRNLQMNCLHSVMLYDSWIENFSKKEVNALQEVAKKVKQSLDLNQLAPEEREYYENLVNYYLNELGSQ